MICQLDRVNHNIGDTARAVIFTFALLAASACQTVQSVSVEEAKQITATFEGSAYTPPPRTINDIAAILEQEKQVNQEALGQFRIAATLPIPVDAKKIELAKFYQNRGAAAGEIGDFRQQLDDLIMAEHMSIQADPLIRGRILSDLSIAEFSFGNRSDALRHREQAVASIPAVETNLLISRAATLARLYASMGDMERADQTFEKARIAYLVKMDSGSSEASKNNSTYSIRRAEAKILFYKGRYAESETVARAAQQANERVNNVLGAKVRNEEALHLELSKTLVRLGRLVEAEIEARNSLTSRLRRLGRYTPRTARSLRSLSDAIGAQGRHEEAELIDRAVIEILERIGSPKNSFMLAAARRKLAGTFVNQGQWEEALAEFELIKGNLADDPKSLERFTSNLNWALALLGANRAEEGRIIAETAFFRKKETLGEKHNDTASALGVMGMTLAELGNYREAYAAFSKAIPILLSRSRQSDDEDTTQAAQDKRIGLILESYVNLLSEIRGTDVERESGIDAAAEAFRIADVARARSVQQALAASGARAAAKDPELSDLARREQDAQKQIGSLYGLYAELVSVPAEQQDQSVNLALRVQIDNLRAARAVLAEEIERRFPEYAELINPKPLSIKQARASLQPGEALISTYVSKEKTYIWAVPQIGDVSFIAANVGRDELINTVALLRDALDPNASTLGDIPAFDLKTAYRLFETLLAPVQASWKDADSLLVVAHGPLGYLPLSVLPTKRVTLGSERGPLFGNYKDVPWLARSHAITMLPSVASLKSLRELPPASATRQSFAGFGDPLFSVDQAVVAAQETKVAKLVSRGLTTRGLPVRLRAAPKVDGVDSADFAQLPRLPDTADEVRGIALAMNADLTKSLFLGTNASEDVVKSMDLAGFKVLAFATHGLVPGDLNGLRQPALALSSPNVTGGKDDGLLTMGEILGLRLDADWVILSACNTGSGQGAGAEAVSGLGRAFFYAGTRALLVSNWPVETSSAKTLTTDLFLRQAKDPVISRAQALRKAMVGLIDGDGPKDADGKIIFSYAHPLFWAPFSLIGDGGGGKPSS